VEHRQSTLIPRLDHNVAAGYRNDRAVMRDAVFLLCLWRRQLVITLQLQLPIDDFEDGVAAPLNGITLAASRPCASTPLVGEDDLRAVVVEGCGVPIREILVPGIIETDGMNRIRNIEQNAIAGTRARRQPDFRKDRDVVALVGF